MNLNSPYDGAKILSDQIDELSVAVPRCVTPPNLCPARLSSKITASIITFCNAVDSYMDILFGSYYNSSTTAVWTESDIYAALGESRIDSRVISTIRLKPLLSADWSAQCLRALALLTDPDIHCLSCYGCQPETARVTISGIDNYSSGCGSELNGVWLLTPYPEYHECEMRAYAEIDGNNWMVRLYLNESSESIGIGGGVEGWTSPGFYEEIDLIPCNDGIFNGTIYILCAGGYVSNSVSIQVEYNPEI